MSAFRRALIVIIPACALAAAGVTVGRAEDLNSLRGRGPDTEIIVSGSAAWTDSQIHVQAGDVVTVTARGRVTIAGARQETPLQAGPEGTFHFSDDVAHRSFPLPAAARGPSPCYALIGREGDGDPFFVGQRKSWRVAQSGRLRFGINHYDPGTVEGRFVVRIEAAATVRPVSIERVVRTRPIPCRPRQPARVVVFYVDGLRPDVVREMAAMGHLPNIRRRFMENGTWLSNAFTAFPSDTITSNGTMWTGCFSDRHGLKGQVRFSRRTLNSQSYLEPLGPNRGSRLLAPTGIDRLLLTAQSGVVGAVRGDAARGSFTASRTTAVPPLYAHLRADGRDWSTGVLPLMTEMPPLLWTRSMVRYMPYFQANEAWRFIDDANSHYAIQHLIPRDNPVTIIWLPETDSVSHKLSRGQFGMTRRTIAQADRLIGCIIQELEKQQRLESSFLMLVSDHGHHGGRLTHLAHFDLANEVFHRSRELTRDGRWVGGGLGMSVRQHRYWNRHKRDKSKEFVFLDGQSDGAARIFLPRGHYRSGRWMGPHQPGTVLRYRVDQDRPPVNLLEVLTHTRALHSSGRPGYPIDLVLLRLSTDTFLISTLERGSAVIERRRSETGGWQYRYTVVENVRPTPRGGAEFDVTASPRTDPLRLMQELAPHELYAFHSEREWLELTVDSRYPDSVVALSRHMFWQENLSHRQPEFEPDLVVTARPGWYFGTKSSPGTMHGYPFRDSMRSCWFVAGPGIRRGARVSVPCRLVDLTPTILEMVGDRFEVDAMDGRPLRTIYSEDSDAVVRVRQSPQAGGHDKTRLFNASREPDYESDISAVYWDDVDLSAWRPLEFEQIPQYDHAPLSINRPAESLDLNNVAYNLVAAANLSIFRLIDDVIAPISGGRRLVLPFVEKVESRARHSSRNWVSEGATALNVSQLVLGDYAYTSVGNLRRVDGLVDWTQSQGADVQRVIAKPFKRDEIRRASLLTQGVDLVQTGLWEGYRFAQRVIVQVLDEAILNGLENTTDRTINRFRKTPAESIVQEPVERAVFR